MQIDENQINKITFTSTLKNHRFVLELDFQRKQALINEINIKFDSPVELALLLEEIKKKLNTFNIGTIVQQILPGDWENIISKIKEFKYINTNHKEGFVNVLCRVDDFPIAFMKGLGFDNELIVAK